MVQWQADSMIVVTFSQTSARLACCQRGGQLTGDNSNEKANSMFVIAGAPGRRKRCLAAVPDVG